MRHPRLLIALFLLALLLIDVAMVGLRLGIDAEGMPSALFWAVYASQFCLIGIWLALGRTELPLRLVLPFAMLVAWNMAFYILTLRAGELVIFSGMISVVVAIPLYVTRFFGLELALRQSDSTQKPTPLAARRYQFSILNVLVLMTCVALFLGMQPYLSICGWRHSLYDVVDSLKDKEMQFHAAAHGIITWAAVWIVLGHASPPWRIFRNRRAQQVTMLLLAVVIAWLVTYYFTLTLCFMTTVENWHVFRLGCYNRWLGGHESRFIQVFITVVSLNAIPLFGSLFVFCLAGYRLTFRVASSDGRQVDTK